MIREIDKFPVQYNRQYLFQIDSYRESKAVISEKVTDDIQDAIGFMLNINSLMPYKNDKLESFIEAFEHRYEGQEIPLLEALDPDVGIGYPIKTVVHELDSLIEDISYPITNISSYRLSPVEILIIRKTFEQVRYRRDAELLEIELSKRDFNQFKTIDPKCLPPTCKVMLKIKYDNLHNSYTYYIKLIEGPTATNFLSRFCYLNDEIEDIVGQICDKEKEILKDNGILAEIVHLPQSRIGNIAYRPILRDIEIHLLYLQLIISQYFASNKSEIWS